MSLTNTSVVINCYHCHEKCEEDKVKFDDKDFCCVGCKLVYEVLNENNLCNYYAISDNPGINRKNSYLGNRFAFLEEEQIIEKLISFKSKNEVHIRFHIPNMHCSSCIWLLENFSRIDKGVIRSQVDFVSKEILIVFNSSATSLRNIVEQLTLIGYEPELNLNKVSNHQFAKKSNARIYKIGLAGFAFGNIMLLSFPEYLSGGVFGAEDFRHLFRYVIVVLALPVFFYSASEFFINSFRSFRQKVVNIDVPIAIGILAMFLRSLYEIVSGTGPGYFDSMTGLIFFMLIGRNFQDKTYQWLSFNRDYTSYFPIAVTRYNGIKEETVLVNDVVKGDRLKIRNHEIIPADVKLLNQSAHIDYSFVSGESTPIKVNKGELIYAGAKLLNGPIDVMVDQATSNSYLTKLWNQQSDKVNQTSYFQKMVNTISRWFVLVTVVIAISSFAYWYHQDFTRAINAFTAVLVIACACALALSAPFTFGNIIRLLGKKGIYLRNVQVIEKLADIDTVIFDKTGTLTEPESNQINYVGVELSDFHLRAIYTIVSSSTHPLSIVLSKYLKLKAFADTSIHIEEFPGQGLTAMIFGHHYKIGSEEYLTGKKQLDTLKSTRVYIGIDNEVYGYFAIQNKYREGVQELTSDLSNHNIQLGVISGDDEHERINLSTILPEGTHMRFHCKPIDKLNYINELNQHGFKTMMVGDGLNDAGALMHSHVGIAISNDINNFTPACDAIIIGSNLSKLEKLIRLAKSANRIIIISFIISLVYNFLGLWFAVQGTLSPVIAAILMPISTSSLVIYTVVASSIKARQLGFTK
ncbi:MAG: heavy metal translocating P-type ATPase [Bacteroidota bacterium]